MKILLVSPKGQFAGGIAKWTGHILQYYRQLSDKSILLDHFDIARSAFINDDISFWPRLRLVIKDYKSILKGYRRFLKHGKYDVIHLTSSAGWGLLRDLYMIRLAKRKGFKTIVHFRFGRIPQLFESKNWEWKLLRRVVVKSDKIIVIDKHSYQTLLQAGYQNIALLSNPLSPKVDDYIKSLPITQRNPRSLLFVGHCIATKGVYELVMACKSIPNIHLRLLGAFHEKVRQDLMSISEGGTWLELLGEKPYEDVIREMMLCDIFVLPTYTEGFPNVILEAMACGCAIITTPVGAIPEMLEEENGKHFGSMVAPRDVQQLNEAILVMLDNNAYKVECGNNARKRVNERYTMTKVWDSMSSIWKDCANGM